MDAHLERQICQRIKQARKKAGFSQVEMADLLNLTERGYQNYESVRVPFRRLSEIAKLTGVPEDWLLRGDQQSAPQAEVPAELMRQVADGVAVLERSQENVLERLREILDRLDALAVESLQSRAPGTSRRTDSPQV